MFQAIASMLSQTIDIYLKVNSSEVRRRRFGRTMYAIYLALEDIEGSIDGVELALNGRTKFSDVWFYSTLSKYAKQVNDSIGRLAGLFEAESWDFWELRKRPELLRRLDIYDRELVDVMCKAWFLDGGFVEALHRLGLYADFDRKVLRLLDEEFDPTKHGFGRRVKPSQAIFDPQKKADMNTLTSIITEARQSVQAAK